MENSLTRGSAPRQKDPHFSVSLGGEAFFVVGLILGRAGRPGGSTHPLVFNLPDQCNGCAEGLYGKLQSTIAKRNLALRGSLNQVLQRFDSGSEARRYGRRAVEDDWVLPLRPQQLISPATRGRLPLVSQHFDPINTRQCPELGH
ncbi:MAG: YqcI/YcgG family protein [Caulobacteraceae bacterium]|nr:YqcI/YcgG family protein [Caulobacteraceae bacterium]